MTAEKIAASLSEREQDAILVNWGRGMTRREQAVAYAHNPKWYWLGLVVREENPELYTVTPLGHEVYALVKTLRDIQKRLA